MLFITFLYLQPNFSTFLPTFPHSQPPVLYIIDTWNWQHYFLILNINSLNLLTLPYHSTYALKPLFHVAEVSSWMPKCSGKLFLTVSPLLNHISYAHLLPSHPVLPAVGLIILYLNCCFISWFSSSLGDYQGQDMPYSSFYPQHLI